MLDYDIIRSGVYLSVFASIITAPLLEESSKRFALVWNFPWVYVWIFAITEAYMYVTMYNVALADRMPVIAVHVVLMGLQVVFHRESVKRKNKYISYCGFLLALGGHAFYNLGQRIFY